MTSKKQFIIDGVKECRNMVEMLNEEAKMTKDQVQARRTTFLEILGRPEPLDLQTIYLAQSSMSRSIRDGSCPVLKPIDSIDFRAQQHAREDTDVRPKMPRPRAKTQPQQRSRAQQQQQRPRAQPQPASRTRLHARSQPSGNGSSRKELAR